MTDLVPRTVTELGNDGSPANRQPASDDYFDWGDILTGDDTTDWNRVLAGEDFGATSRVSRTLEDFRDSAAYVLLGAPGAGKTELFKAEGKREGCHYVTARGFIARNIEQLPPEWRDTTLFIDGLDEKRAGSSDGRTPLDATWTRLEALGRPRFRLSCREADWFGANDRIHLETVSRDHRVKVLRLDPLSDEGIRGLLNRRPDVDEPDAFMEDARARGIDHLLTNPHNLNMLAKAVAGGPWPESRMRTFELACANLVQEPNPEHQIAFRDRPGTPELLAAAGRLFAIQLLTGHDGYDEFGVGDDSEYLGLESIPGNDRTTLHLTLDTRLFESPSEESRRIPVHRQVAEFLGARFLAGLIDDGLPVRRALALITGEDGGIVSELRGLAAWLAAHCPQARGELTERDPVGAAAYGDAGVFTQNEKRYLLECLLPLDPSLDASQFTSLVTRDMASVLREILSDRRRDDDHRNLVLFLLCVLANATPLPDLADSLLDLSMNEDHSPNSRHWAAICLAEGAVEHPAQFGSLVRRLLSGLRDGRVRDDGKSMLGRLLQSLYPKFIGPDEIFDYLDEGHERNRHIDEIVGAYDAFWQHYLAMETRPEDAAVVLDKLEEVFKRSEDSRRTGRPPASSLARAARLLVQKALDRTKEHEPQRTLRWLKLAGGENWGSSQSTKAVRAWIEAKPQRYKELLREAVAEYRRCETTRTAKRRVERLLHGARTPSDYGRWCLEEIEPAEGNDNLIKFWFEEAWNALLHGKGAEHLTLEHLESVATKNASLVRVFDRLRTTDLDGPLARMEREDRQLAPVRRRKAEQAFADWRQFFGQHEEALRENRCPTGALNRLAEAYLGTYLDIDGDSGSERLQKLLGDETLVKAAMDGLRGAIQRDDLPTPKQVLAFRSDNQRHLLAFPVIAGLDLIPEDSISALDDSLARVAVALLVASRPPSPGPAWVRRVFESRPNVAAEEIVRFATAALRRGEQQVSFVYEMLDHDWLLEVARIACPRLLRAFPVRAPRHLFNVLTRLLWWGAGNLEASVMEPIVAAKLAARSMTAGQRAYWYAAQLVVSSEPNLARVEAFAEKHANALSGLFAFYQRPFDQTSLPGRLPSPSLGRLVRLLGAISRPLSAVRSEPGKVTGSELVRVMLEVLGTRAEDDALRALAELGDDPRMAAWHTAVQRVQQEQRVVRRDARYQHPNVGALIQSLDSRQPANVADLAALTFEHVSAIARNIRDGNTNDWRQYWEKGGESWRPAHEDDCRDALLSDLNAKLHLLEVDAVPEGRYADGKRSDIRVSYGGFNVPVEIKKSSSRDLWRAIRDQLIAKYTRDPGAAGYGIYLVFWFGREYCQSPESGLRPATASELEVRLRETLTPEEARLISVSVIDVAKS